MKIYRLANVKFDFVSTDDEPPEGVDLGNVWKVFDNAEINPSRSKDITDIATVDGRIVGSTVSSWQPGEDDEMVFSFDIAVEKEFRGMMVGPRLIERAIKEYNYGKDVYVEMGMKPIMRVEVVNMKLSRFMIKHYGFIVDRELPDRVYLSKE